MSPPILIHASHRWFFKTKSYVHRSTAPAFCLWAKSCTRRQALPDRPCLRRKRTLDFLTFVQMILMFKCWKNKFRTKKNFAHKKRMELAQSEVARLDKLLDRPARARSPDTLSAEGWSNRTQYPPPPYLFPYEEQNATTGIGLFEPTQTHQL